MTSAEEIYGKLGLLDAPRRVLIVEDQIGWLFTLTNALEARGHTVVGMIGVLDVDADHIAGLGLDGRVIDPSPKTTEFDAVFLDYNFAGHRHNGASFLRDFRTHSQAAVMGMSSDRGFNEVLNTLGATCSMQKQRLKYALFESEAS